MKYLFLLLLLPVVATAQIDTVTLQVQSSHLFPSFPWKSSYSSKLDQRPGVNYLYSANMEFGLGIYQFPAPGTLNNVTDLPISTFNNLDVSTVEIRGNSLFAGIGDYHVNNNTASGLAILDITNPAAPVMKDSWDSTAFLHGVNHIVIDGDYAYLSTMGDGLFILNIADENNIFFEGALGLDLSWPAPSTNAHNARGMMIKNDTLYVCFDRGGLRVVDVTNKNTPVEIYKYINTSLTSIAAAAYNDIAIKGNYAFVTVDYCGLEIIDISSIPFTSVQWYNPWGCNLTNWSGAAIHTNEVRLGNNDSLLFVTGGQSELFVFDVTDPANTHKVGELVNLNDSLATNGLDVYNGKTALSFIRTPFHLPPLTPFYADPGGLKILDYQVLLQNVAIHEMNNNSRITLAPNPAHSVLQVKFNTAMQESYTITLMNAIGKTIVTKAINGDGLPASVAFSLEDYAEGLYFISVKGETFNTTMKFIRE
ncbi:MAG: T9SS type A sorting domain-containing protein [Bacteroidia bacterium]